MCVMSVFKVFKNSSYYKVIRYNLLHSNKHTVFQASLNAFNVQFTYHEDHSATYIHVATYVRTLLFVTYHI